MAVGVLSGRPGLTVATDVHPTRDHGVGVSRLRSTEAAHFGFVSTDHHVVWLQLSDHLPVTTWLAGRSLAHQPGCGSLGIAPATADSEVRTDGSLEGIAIRVSAECLALANAQLARHGAVLRERMSGRDSTLFELGRALESEAAQGRPRGALFWSSAADALIRRLAARHVSVAARPARTPLAARAMKRLDEYIQNNLASPLDLETLAAVGGCDRFLFARGFRAAVGMTPHRYVTRVRLDRARVLIQAGKASLAEIALDTGFYDQSHMANWIRRIYGATPLELSGRR